MKQKTRSKFLTTLNIILLVLLFAIPAAAYWAGAIGGANEDTTADIQIGEGQNVITTVELTKTVVGGNLVPTGRAVETTDVEEVVLTFDVLWTDTDEASHGADGVLTVTPKFDNNPANLLNVVVDGNGAITAGETKEITLTITLTEPADRAEYELVANKTFTLEITFEVVPKE